MSDDDFDDSHEDQIPCPNCGEFVYDDAPQCPSCGEYIVHDQRAWSHKPSWLRWTGLVLVLLVVLAFLLPYLAGLLGLLGR